MALGSEADSCESDTFENYEQLSFEELEKKKEQAEKDQTELKNVGALQQVYQNKLGGKDPGKGWAIFFPNHTLNKQKIIKEKVQNVLKY